MAVALPALLEAAGASTATAATATTLLTIGAGVMGAASTIQAGRQQAAMYKQQAQQYDLNASLEKLKGRQEAMNIRQQTDQNLSSINAVFGARGGYSGSGTPAQAMIESQKNSSNSVDRVMFNSNMQAGQLSAQANNYRAEARGARRAGIMNAVTGLAKSDSFGNSLKTLLE